MGKTLGLMDRALLLENGEVLITDVRIDREFLIPSLLYGVEGMKIGGKRKIKVSPHLAYGEKGIAGIIPERAGARTSQWKTCYDSLRERGLTTTAASVAIARKMARLAFALMRDQTEYQPKYGERTCLFT